MKLLLITARQTQIGQLTRDYDKLRRRVEGTARVEAQKIDRIIIDGNNLCYSGSTFIGLVAIESLLPELSRRFLVVVVFDAKIRQLLDSNDSAITERLGRHATVHIVATRRHADETVLDLASANEFTFVLSNDRFSEFFEKPAVKGRRIIRHEIVDRQVLVHDLQLRAAFELDARPGHAGSG